MCRGILNGCIGKDLGTGDKCGENPEAILKILGL